jgi:metal-responsive CopG/Arc/MetJ family transcriptional regulator
MSNAAGEKKLFSMYLRVDLAKKLDEMSKQNYDCGRAKLINRIVEDYFKEKESKVPKMSG